MFRVFRNCFNCFKLAHLSVGQQVNLYVPVKAIGVHLSTGTQLPLPFCGAQLLSVEQVTVLGSLMLIAHSLPVEGAVARRAGAPWWVTITLRVGGAMALAGILHFIYSGFMLFPEPARFLWRPEVGQATLSAWSLSQIKALGMIFIVILALMVLMQLLRFLGLERLIHIGLAPLLRVLGISQSAANVTVIGVALGLSYGAGLLIRDLDAGVMSQRDSFLALCFIGLAHSMIKDTLLIMALGADLSGILWARLVFSIAVIALLARCASGFRFGGYA